MGNKKGVSPLLAAVLLVAFAIALGAIVSNYLIKQAKEFNPEKIAEESVFCESVTLGYDIDDPTNLGFQEKTISGRPFTFFEYITVINRGAFSIHQLIISAGGMASRPYPIYDDAGQISNISAGVNNRYNLSINMNRGSNDEIKIVPVIKDPEKDVFVRCADRQLVINYTQLCIEVKDEPC